MTKEINFTKMTAAGNDFVMIDNRRGAAAGAGLSASALARKLCDRKFGVGADGLILLENSRRADFRMRYLNADGSEVSMCGNGARSIARFAASAGAVKKSAGVFETPAGLIKYALKKNTVKIALTPPRGVKLGFPLDAEGRRFRAHFADTGVPHVVIFVDDLEKTPVTALGRAIRCHKMFSPSGTNVNFVKITGASSMSVRTYERGVEDETLACGTGVTASAIISGLLGKVRPPVKALTRGGATLAVDYKILRGADIAGVFLEGPAEKVFTGRASL